MIYPASHLREKAAKKIAQDKSDLNDWSANLVEAISDWCDDLAEAGEMSCEIVSADLESMLDSDVPEDKIYSVIFGAKKILEETYIYRVTIDDFNTKTKSQDDYIHSITVDWSG